MGLGMNLRIQEEKYISTCPSMYNEPLIGASTTALMNYLGISVYYTSLYTKQWKNPQPSEYMVSGIIAITSWIVRFHELTF